MARTKIDALGEDPGAFPSRADAAILGAVDSDAVHEIGSTKLRTSADVAQSSLVNAESTASLLRLQNENAQLRDERDNARAELSEIKAERDHLAAQAEAKRPHASDPADMDFSKPYRVNDLFIAHGLHGTFSYEAGTVIRDAQVLRQIHQLGAKLSPA